jgi:acetyl esterase/lipase
MLLRYVSIAFVAIWVALRTDAEPVFASIDSGYGAAGPYHLVCDSFPHPRWPDHYVYTYHPGAPLKNIPVLFFCHGIGATHPSAYLPLIKHVVSRGFALVYVPYSAIPVDRSQTKAYTMLYDGFCEAVSRLRTIIDTSKIGIVGHSYGGGATPYITYRMVTEKKWGATGAFMYIMAAWFSCEITPWQLATFPNKVTMVTQVFDNDRINDHRMSKFLFDKIAIPLAEKSFVILYSDSIPGMRQNADHNVPIGAVAQGGTINTLDDWGVYRPLDALADYTFTGSKNAKAVVLPPSAASELPMGVWPDGRPVRPGMILKQPRIVHPQNWYINFWDHTVNPQNTYTSSYRADLPLFYYTRLTLRNYLFTIHNVAHAPRGSTTTGPCVVQQPLSGYGCNGPWTMTTDSFPNPGLSARNVYVFAPIRSDTLWPVVLFSHAFRLSQPRLYLPLIRHIVSQGFVVIFSSYFVVDVDHAHAQRYDLLQKGFEEGLMIKSHCIDTSRIGFIGHSFGGGATPAIAHHFLVEKGWGKSGAFLFIMAPWYAYYINPAQLAGFPSTTKMIVQVYDQERYNDWRIAYDLFRSIGIPDSAKNFLIVRSANHTDCMLTADHHTPEAKGDRKDPPNALDFYGIYRHLDALADFSFTGRKEAQSIALGNNSAQQRFMGLWPDGTPVQECVATNRPDTVLTRKRYLYRWNNILNKRRHLVDANSFERP